MTTSEADGATSAQTDAKSLLTRLNLAYSDQLAPLVSLRAGGVFERSQSWSDEGEGQVGSTASQVSSYLDLSFGTRFVHGGLGYSRRQVWSGSTSPAVARESYQANLGFQPEDLPSLDVQALRTDTFDLGRQTQNLRTEHLSWSSRYGPFRDLQFHYSGGWDQNRDLLKGTEVATSDEAGRASYSTRFFRGRGSVSANYNVAWQASDTRAGKAAEFSSRVSPLGGLSALSATPGNGALAPNAALVDGNVTTAGGVDLGLPPLGGDRTPRNLGLDFGTAVDVNALEVWVDKELPTEIAASFAWAVYASDDNLGWTRLQTVAGAPFGPFDFRFLLRFSTVHARYVKVVAAPLAPTVVGSAAFANIAVTELRASLFVPSRDVKPHSTSTAQTYDLSARLLLLQDPSLSYDFAYFYAKSLGEESARRSTINSLSLSRKLGELFLLGAQVRREDSTDPTNQLTGYTYGASLAATPLPTLSHTLTFSGRRQTDEKETTRSESLFLNNSAALYRGVDLVVAGGVNQSSSSTGKESKGSTLTVGTSVVPHPSVTVNLSYTEARETQSGGAEAAAQAAAPTRSSRTEGSVSWSPTSALYLFASLGLSSDTDQPSSKVQSYAVGWSPLRGGGLQLGVNYSETVKAEDSSTQKAFSPSLHWQVGPKVGLDVSYLWAAAESATQSTRSWAYSVNLRATL